MSKNPYWNQCKSDILDKNIGKENIKQQKEKSVYELNNGILIMFKFSRSYGNQPYWFGISKKRMTKFFREKLFILLVCETPREPDVIVLTSTYILNFLGDIIPAEKDGNWKFHVSKKANTDFTISASRKKQSAPPKEQEVSSFVNRFDLIFDKSANPNKQDAFPEEILELDNYYEGAIKQIKINRYERDLAARNKCIKHYGLNCYVCRFNFEDKYGSIGKEFIHVHHLKPLSEIGCEYELDPIQDLRPVCPNCHAMIHRKRPPYSIEEISKLLNQQEGV